MLQPYIDTIVQALVGLLVVFVLGVIAMLRKRVEAWLDARTTAAQRETLHKLAQEAMSLAEVQYKSGQIKLDKAIRYVLDRAAGYGINVGMDTIRAAVEKAVLDYNANVKQGGGNNANKKPE